MSHNRSVNKITGYGLEVMVSIHSWAHDFSYPKVQTGSAAHQTSNLTGTGRYFPQEQIRQRMM
jgi:hypothetical protein